MAFPVAVVRKYLDDRGTRLVMLARPMTADQNIPMTSLAHGPFPVADPQYLVEDTVEYPVQVNGKVRGRVTVRADSDADTLEAAALADEKVLAFLNGATPKSCATFAA